MTPLPHRAVFYRTLAQMLSAGASVQVSMESALAHLPARTRHSASQAINAAIAQGEPISRALAVSAQFPAAHVRYLGLAEKSGHLDTLLRELADFTDEIIGLRRAVLSGLALPAVYLVVAALVVPLPAFLLGGSFAQYLASSLGFLAIIVLGGWGALIVCQRAPGALLDRVLRPLPIFGPAWREFDYWSFTRTLAFLSRTSLGVLDSVRLAADTCRSPKLATALRGAAEQAESRGTPLSPLLRASGELPPDMIALWQTGEQSGRLDETFQRLAIYFAERCKQRLKELAIWTPRLGYFAVAGYMVWQILNLAGAYIGSLNAVMKGL